MHQWREISVKGGDRFESAVRDKGGAVTLIAYIVLDGD